MEQKKVEYRCNDCGVVIPETTYDRFGVCADCHHKRYPPDKVESEQGPSIKVRGRNTFDIMKDNKIELPDVPKEYSIEDWNGSLPVCIRENGDTFAFCHKREPAERIVNALKQLADLRAEFQEVVNASNKIYAEKEELRADHDKLTYAFNALNSQNNRIMAERDKLKEELNYYSDAYFKQAFTSELQRRWPSEEEKNDWLKNNASLHDNLCHESVARSAIRWLKSYLENE